MEKTYDIWCDGILMSIESNTADAFAYADNLHEQYPESKIDVLTDTEETLTECVYGYN